MTTAINVNTSGLWQYSTIMKYLPRRFQIPIFKLSLRKFEKTGRVTPWIIDLENLILDDLIIEPIVEDKVEVRAKHLYLHLGHEENDRSNFTNAKLCKSILETRGKLRWLCFRLIPEVFSNSYEISRGKLMIQVLLNWKTFREKVLDKLFISESISKNVVEIDNYEYTHPNIKFIFSKSQYYFLGRELTQDLEYNIGLDLKRRVPNELLLGRLILWDSSAVLYLIRHRENFASRASVLRYLQNFPDFKSQISMHAKLQVKIHPNAALTFDERMQHGQISPDILKNVSIWHQRFIVQGETWHVVDSTSSPYVDYVAGHWQFLEPIPDHLEYVYLKKPKTVKRVNLKQAIYLLGRADENWYHLLLDTLPRYLQLRDIGKDVPILVRSDLPTTSISLIKSLIPRRIIFVAHKDLIFVEKLFFIAARSTVYDSKSKNGQDQVQFSPQTIRDLRDFVLNRLNTHINVKLPDKIFIARRSKYRNLINMEQLQRRLKTLGFETVETNSDFYLEQHSYFHQANKIVSPGGAVLANIIFMKPGSKILLIRSWRDSDLNLWKKLAESCEVNFTEAIGIPTYYGRKALARQHSNFYLPTPRFRKFL